MLQSLSTINEQSAPLLDPNEYAHVNSSKSEKNLLKLLLITIGIFNFVAVVVLFGYTTERKQGIPAVSFDKQRLLVFQRDLSRLTSANQVQDYLYKGLKTYCEPKYISFQVTENIVHKLSFKIHNKLILANGKDYKMIYNLNQNYTLNYKGLVKPISISNNCYYSKKDLLELNVIPLLKISPKCHEYEKVINRLLMDVGFNAVVLMKPSSNVKVKSIKQIIKNTNKTIIMVSDLVGRLLLVDAVVRIKFQSYITRKTEQNNIVCELEKSLDAEKLVIVANGRDAYPGKNTSYDGKAIGLQLADSIAKTRNLKYNVKLIFVSFDYNKIKELILNNNQTIFIDNLATKSRVLGKYCEPGNHNILISQIAKKINSSVETSASSECKTKQYNTNNYLQIYNSKDITGEEDTIRAIERISNIVKDELTQ